VTYKGKGWKVIVPVIQTDCPAGAISGGHTVVGWTEMVIAQVINKGQCAVNNDWSGNPWTAAGAGNGCAHSKPDGAIGAGFGYFSLKGLPRDPGANPRASVGALDPPAPCEDVPMSYPQSGIMRIGGLALGLAVAFSTSGCVAAGVAAGPLMSAVQLLTDRTVERTVGADLTEAQDPTEPVLARMAFQLESREHEEGIRRLRAEADGVTVHVKLERVTAKLTRVGLRVEVGKMTADRDTGTQMHEQIA